MGWEWLDTVEGLEGSIAEIGGLNTTWDYALLHIGNPDTYAKQISYSSQYNTPPASISGSEGAFYHDLTTQITKDYTTNWGFTISYKYLSGSGAGTSGNISWTHDGRSAAISGSNMRSAVRFAVDHERQIAVMILAYYYNVGANYLSLNALWSTYEGQNTAPYLYQLLMEHQPPQYVWSSVPAISGKNGILTLSTLVDINDGNPVETTDTTKFTLTSASNVKTLVDAVPLGSLPASGGGASGSNPQYGGQTITGKSGTQESGYAFGQGGASGGGGGFYGGYGAEDDVSPAGAGSGYIGNPLLSNKKMYGYGVSKVTTEDAYTVSKTDHSSAAIEKRPKAGNGHARITYLRPSEHPAPVWDGHFFNADFSTDGRDSVRYDSSRTVVCPIDNSDMEPHTAIQGTMFEGFDETGWSISNGVLDIGNAEYSDKSFIWLYDYEHIENKILPRSCTFYIDIDFWIYDDDYPSVKLSFHSPYTYYDRYGYLNLIEYMTFGLSFSDYFTPYVITEGIDERGESYRSDYDIGSSPLPITYQTWHNLKAKVEILSSRVSKITLYFDNVEFASKEFDAATEQVPFVCINDNDTRPVWFCKLSGGHFKIRKVFVGRSVT